MDTNPKYALKKLSIGLASVIIGIAFYGVSANADDQPVANNNQTVNTAATPNTTPAVENNTENNNTTAPVAQPATPAAQTVSAPAPQQPTTPTVNYGTVDTTKWKGKMDYDNTYELTDYTGDVNHVVIPNLNDLTSVNAKGVKIDPKVLFDLTQNGMQTLQISHTTGKQSSKVGIYESSDTGYLRSVFGGTVSTTTNKPVYNPAPSKDKNTPSYVYNSENNQFGNKLIAMDLGNLDVSNIKNFDGMFAGLNSLQILTGLDQWNTVNGINFTSMFDGAKKLNELNLASWNMKNANSINSIFRNDNNLTTVGDLSQWDTSNLTDIINAFYNDENLTGQNFVSHWNVDKVTSLSGLFTNNQKLTKLDLSNWNTKNVTSMAYTFQNDNNLTEIIGLDKLDTSNVTNMSYLFANDSLLSSITKLNDWNVSKVTDFSYTFINDPYYLQQLDFSKWNTSAAVNFDHFLSISPNNLTGAASKLNTTVDKLKIWNNHSIENLDTSNTANFNNMFSGYSQFTGIANLSKYDFSKAQVMNRFIDPFVNAVIYLGSNHTLPLKDHNIFTAGNVGNPGNIKESNQSAYRVILSDDPRLLNQNQFYNYLHILSNGNNVDNIAINTVINPTSALPATDQVAWGKSQITSAIQAAIVSGDAYLHNQGIKIDPNSAPDSDNLVDLVNAFYGVNPIMVTQGYQFVDDDLNGQSVGKVINISGQLTKTATVKLTTPANYQLAKGQTLPTITPTLKDNNPVITIHLIHHHSDVTGQQVNDPATGKAINDHVERVYQLIEDLPNGSHKTVLSLHATIYRATDRDDVTGAITYGQYGPYSVNKYNHTSPNSTTELDSSPDRVLVQVDNVPGYHYQIDQTGHQDNRFDYSYTDGLTIFEITKNDTWAPYPGYGIDLFNKTSQRFDSVLPSEDFHIKYLPDSKAVTVNYYDLSGNKLQTQTINSVYNADLNIANTTPANYILITGQDTHFHVGLQDNELDLLVAPAITKSTESKTIRRTIIINLPNHQQAQTVVQSVVFIREKITNNQNQSVSYTEWIANGQNSFKAYIPAIIDGYTAQQADSQAVTTNDKESTIVLTYSPAAKEETSKYIDVNGVGHDTIPTGYHIVSGQDNNKGSILIVKDTPKLTNKIEYVTRTITINMPNGKHRTITQKTRKGTKFLTPHLPHLRGYTTQLTQGVISTDPAESDSNIVISFLSAK